MEMGKRTQGKAIRENERKGNTCVFQKKVVPLPKIYE
jgi:hypothetical protein